MMMNRTKSAVDALLKLRFKGICITTTRSFAETPFSDLQIGLESGPPPASPIHPNPCSSNVVDHSFPIFSSRVVDHSYPNCSDDLEDPLAFVDDITHMLEVVTKHNHDVCYKKSCVSFINSFLIGLIFEDRIHEAHMFLIKLIKQKLCEPTTLMYNTVITALCDKNDETMMDDALKLFQEMVSQPDVFTYNSLVSGLCKIRRWTKATLLLKEMLDKDISPDAGTFNLLINTFCIEGRLHVARHVIYMMHERGISPNIATYNLLIDAHCVKGEMVTARSLVNLMASNHLAPDTATYTSLLNAYCNDDKMDDAMLIYHEMNEKGFKPNCVTYSRMIQSCFSAARFGDAHKLLDDMLAQGQTLDTRTYDDILHDLVTEHQLEEAISLFHLLCDDSKLNSDMFDLILLLDGAINCGKLDLARELFEGLSARGMKPRSLIYTIMISGFCAEGLVNDAKRLFLEMEENHCWPTTETYNYLLQGYLKNKWYDDVNVLLHKMKKPRHFLNELTFSMLHDSVAAGSLDATLSSLIDKLAGEDGVSLIF